MSCKVRKLRSLIYAEYDTEADLARDLGWSRQKLSKITNGIKEPDVREIAALSVHLGKPLGFIAELFCLSSHQVGNLI